MGAGQSKLDDDFEGKYFTTGDGIKVIYLTMWII